MTTKELNSSFLSCLFGAFLAFLILLASGLFSIQSAGTLFIGMAGGLCALWLSLRVGLSS